MTTEPNVVDLQVPPEHPCYADHFPGRPIVPGALLLQWLCGLVREQRPQHRVCGVITMKFLQTLAPGDLCQLRTAPGASEVQLKVQLRRGEILVCQGVLELQAADPALP